MSEPVRIESPSNPRIKQLVRLRERRIREREGRFLIEGTRELARALQGGLVLQEVFVCRELLRPEGRRLLDTLPGVARTELSEVAFRKASYRDSPDGLIASAATPDTGFETLQLGEAALVLILESLEKPGNSGALLRTADAVGADAVIVTGTGTDLYNPNVIRASMGSVFSVPVLTVASREALDFCQDRGLSLIVSSPAAEGSYWDADYRRACAVVLGAEATGLTDVWLHAAGAQRVSIPMSGSADSLNVATSGALLLYEALRQRRRA